jgi:hypothetical protein
MTKASDRRRWSSDEMNGIRMHILRLIEAVWQSMGRGAASAEFETSMIFTAWAQGRITGTLY